MIRLRRSILFAPASNPRALEKARTLPIDALVLDLEDAVAPAAKVSARQAAIAAFASGDWDGRERVIRVNSLHTPWGLDDLAAIAQAFTSGTLDAVCLPKVETVPDIIATLAALNAAPLPLWLMIETPRGVLAAAALAAHPAVAGLVIGTSDLAKELNVRPGPDRAPLHTALSQVVLAARAAEKFVIDGVTLDIHDSSGHERACQQGRDWGFDGKSLIHPSQIAAANQAFSPSAAEIADAHALLAAFAKAEAEGAGVALYQGKLVENLHRDAANHLLERAKIIARQELMVAEHRKIR